MMEFDGDRVAQLELGIRIDGDPFWWVIPAYGIKGKVGLWWALMGALPALIDDMMRRGRW